MFVWCNAPRRKQSEFESLENLIEIRVTRKANRGRQFIAGKAHSAKVVFVYVTRDFRDNWVLPDVVLGMLHKANKRFGDRFWGRTVKITFFMFRYLLVGP